LWQNKVWLDFFGSQTQKEIYEKFKPYNLFSSIAFAGYQL